MRIVGFTTRLFPDAEGRVSHQDIALDCPESALALECSSPAETCGMVTQKVHFFGNPRPRKL
jgi:hypothetical protein